MSFLGIGGGSTPAGSVNHDRIEMMVNEVEMVQDVFNKIVSSCHNKCISGRYAEGDLTKGESVCVDRCVAKFFAVNKIVGERMQATGASMGAAVPGGGRPL